MILDRIVQVKQQEIIQAKQACPLAVLEKRIAQLNPARDFFGALVAGSELKVIAEVKKASPSKGLIRPDFEPVSLARAYLAGGAAALSVLTDEQFFQGSLAFVAKIREEVPLPVLRKDFILDAYQVFQSRAAGADAILLIARLLGLSQLKELLALTRSLGMVALVEVHSGEELAKSLTAGAKLIGINNRDLATFHTDLRVTLDLAGQVPPGCLLVSESGIRGPEDLGLLARAGVKAVLVGEALAREQDAAAATARLVQGGKGL